MKQETYQKLKILAERGCLGEKDVAKKMLEKFKNNVVEDLENCAFVDFSKISYQDFKKAFTLLKQIVAKTVGFDLYDYNCLYYDSSKQHIIIKTCNAEYCKYYFEILWNAYKKQYKEMLKEIHHEEANLKKKIKAKKDTFEYRFMGANNLLRNTTNSDNNDNNDKKLTDEEMSEIFFNDLQKTEVSLPIKAANNDEIKLITNC